MSRELSVINLAHSGAVLVRVCLLNHYYWCPRGFREPELAEGTD